MTSNMNSKNHLQKGEVFEKKEKMIVDPREYFEQKGFEFRVSAGQIVLRRCPFCLDEGFHFYVSPEEGGLFFCHKCSEKGNMHTLQKHFGDIGDLPRQPWPGSGSSHNNGGGISPAFKDREKRNRRPDPKLVTQAHERLLKDPEALSYVTEARGIPMRTLKHFSLGVSTDLDGTKWLTIPHYRKGELVNIKSRSLPPAEKAFRRVKDCPSVLFNADVLAGEGAEQIYMAEGELDTLTLWSQGITNVVGVTIGARSFPPEWVDQLKDLKKIFICYDPDEAGQIGAREVARRLRFGRCFNIVLPAGQDVNEFFRSGRDILTFQELVNRAERFDVAGVMSIEAGLKKYLERLKQPEQTAGILTPWPEVNKLISTGFQPGELTVLSSPPKIGKSSWALQIAWTCALKDIPTLFYCLEMRPLKLVQKIIQGLNRCTNDKTQEVSIIEATERKFNGKPLYLGYSYQKQEQEAVIETLREAVRRYGLKFVIFDHLHFLCRSLSNQVQEVGLAVQAFKFLAEEMEIPIILIAQPRKIQPDLIMTSADLKDSSTIFSDCDHLIILHRKRVSGCTGTVEGKQPPHNQAYEPVTLVRVEASRYNPGGEALLYYRGEFSRFDELEYKKRGAAKDGPTE
jgi:hypothetical protein